jgi:hypothetical protein
MGGAVSEHITTNKGLWGGFGLSPPLFSIYINNVIQEWKNNVTGGIQLSNRYILNTILYADNKCWFPNQKMSFKLWHNCLNSIAINFNLNIVTKSMGMCGKDIIRVKIVINGEIIEQVTEF